MCQEISPDMQRRIVIHAMAKTAAMLGDFIVVREVITLSGIGTEQEAVIAEWHADYMKHAYSVWPRYGSPRMPRPLGEIEES